MRKLEIADAAVMQVAIRQEIDRSEESRYDHRRHGLLLVASGRSCTEVSQLFGDQPRRCSAGSADLSSRGWPDCVKASTRAVPGYWTIGSGSGLPVTCAVLRAVRGTPSTCGTARCWPSI